MICFPVKMNIDWRAYCQFFGFTENHQDESILIFHTCSTNLFISSSNTGNCGELHIGNTPRSIMTKGNSVKIGTPYGNFIRGNNDKLMISYRREPSHDYTLYGACGVMFEGDIHFFGADRQSISDDRDFYRQHFVIETQRSGQLVQMKQKEDLEIRFRGPECISLESRVQRARVPPVCHRSHN